MNWGPPLASFALPPNWPTAALRIPATLHPRYEPSFPRLLAAIKLLASGPTYYTARGTTTPLPRFLVNPVELLLLAALDPPVARMLGLYYVDTSAALGTAYDYRIVGHWTAPGSADHIWICFDLERGAPAAVATPTGLTVQARPVGGGLTEATSSANQVTTALAWSLPRDTRGGLEPGAPVLYHVFRQVQKSSAWTQPVQLTTSQPVLIAADAATDALPTDFYIDGPLPSGAYRYQVQGVDLFGRASARSAAVDVTLADEVAPPPPVNVRGRPVQIDGRTDVTVSWEWPAERRAQAGDAAEFRVYYQTENLRPLTGTLTAVRDNGDGTSTVTTDLEPVADPARVIGGQLVNRGQVFPVTSIFATAGTGVISLCVVNPIDDAGTVILPQAAQPINGRAELAFLSDPGTALGHFALQVDWSDPAHWEMADERVPLTAAELYALTLSGLPLATGPLKPVAYAFVGVATVDRVGNLGAVSPPVTVAVAHSVPPVAPPAPSGPTYATRADYHGRSRYTLTLESTETGLYYEVYRALDGAILAKAPPDSADDDASLLTLADQYEDAFTQLDARDAAGQPLVGIGDVVTWTDDLPGTGRNRFVYKVQTVDQAGNRGPLSPGLLVHLIDVVPPRAPVVSRVTGGDRQVVLQWAKNRETDLALYRMYRTEDAAAGADVRTMKLVAAFIFDHLPVMAADLAVDATAALVDDGRGQLSYTDPAVPGQTDLYYRLVAVDTAGNPSRPSPLVQARAYDAARPDPPTWNTPTSSADGLALSWSSADTGLSCLVQRRARDEKGWTRLGRWLARGAYTYTDGTRVDGIVYEYRLLVMDGAGRTNAEFNVLER